MSVERNYAVHSASTTIDIVLDRGAEKLYDKYLNQKLPDHSHAQNNTMFMKNLNLHEVVQPERATIESIPLTAIEHAPIDTMASKRISVSRPSNEFSTLSPKNTTFCKSTKYQTVIHSQLSTLDRNRNPENNTSMILDENFPDTTIGSKNERPSTMQAGRKAARKSRVLDLDSRLEEVQEKRAVTCHSRNRKKFVSSKEKKAKLIKIKEDIPIHMLEQFQNTNRLRRYKNEQIQEQMEKEKEKAKVDMQIRMKQKKTKDNFQQLKQKLQGKSKDTPNLTNFEAHNGQITINGKPKNQKTHIIQLEFNQEDEHTLKVGEPKVTGVNVIKKNTFMTKLKKKMKISNEEYTNNGERQISNIPFISLNYGISLSQSILEATASRRRPSEELSRDQFNDQSTNRFKSHIPSVNSARMNIFASIDENQLSARSSFLEITPSGERKEYQTTLETQRGGEKSILWKTRAKSDSKNIRISNRQVFAEQMMDMKLGH